MPQTTNPSEPCSTRCCISAHDRLLVDAQLRVERRDHRGEDRSEVGHRAHYRRLGPSRSPSVIPRRRRARSSARARRGHIRARRRVRAARSRHRARRRSRPERRDRIRASRSTAAHRVGELVELGPATSSAGPAQRSRPCLARVAACSASSAARRARRSGSTQRDTPSPRSSTRAERSVAAARETSAVTGDDQDMTRLALRTARSGILYEATMHRRPASKQMLEPDERRLGELRDAPHREQHARHEGLAVDRVVADRERLAEVAEDHLLVGDEARQPHRVDRRRRAAVASAISSAVRAAVPLGASSLPSWCSSMISAFAMCRGGLGGEAHHQHRADREVRGDEDVRAGAPPASRSGAEVEAGRADHHVHARPRRTRSAFASAVSGRVKSTTHVGARAAPRRASCRAPGRRAPTSSMSSAPSTAAQTVCAHPPRGAGDGDADHAARRRQRRARRRERRSEARPRRGRCRPPTGARAPNSSSTQRAQVVERRRRRSRSIISSTRQQRQPVEHRARRAGSCARRSTPATSTIAALDVLACARVELLRGRRVLAQALELGADHLHRLGEVVRRACRRRGRPGRCRRTGSANE